MSIIVKGGGGSTAKELVNSSGKKIADLESRGSGKVSVIGGLGTTTPSKVLQGEVFSTDDEVAQIGTYTVPTETKTVTPKATQQVITPSAGKYLSRVTVNGDSDAVPINIRKGVNIFGVDGSFNGVEIKGVTEERTADEQIAEGNFVEFVNSFNTKMLTHKGNLTSKAQFNENADVTALDENRAFVTFKGLDYSDDLYGAVITFSGTDFTMGTATLIATSSSSNGKYPAISSKSICIDNNKVIIFYRVELNSAYPLKAVVAAINGQSITVGTPIIVSSDSNAGKHFDAIKLENNKAFVAYAGYPAKLSGVVLNINGTAISKGTGSIIGDYDYSAFSISSTLIEPNKVFIAHTYNESYHLAGVIITISGNTFSKGTITLLDSEYRTGYGELSACCIDANRVFIAYPYLDTLYLRCMIVSVNGSTITAGEYVGLDNNSSTGSIINAIYAAKGRVLVACMGSGREDYFNLKEVDVFGTTPKKVKETKMGPAYTIAKTKLVLMSKTRLYAQCVYDYSEYKLAGILIEVSGNVLGTKVSKSATNISGVALNSASSGQAVECVHP